MIKEKQGVSMNKEAAAIGATMYLPYDPGRLTLFISSSEFSAMKWA